MFVLWMKTNSNTVSFFFYCSLTHKHSRKGVEPCEVSDPKQVRSKNMFRTCLEIFQGVKFTHRHSRQGVEPCEVWDAKHV